LGQINQRGEEEFGGGVTQIQEFLENESLTTDFAEFENKN